MKESQEINKNPSAELPEKSRLEQLKMLLDELIFKIIGVFDRGYSKISRAGNWLFDLLPVKDSKRKALKSLFKKLTIIFSIIFTVFFVFVWLNPLLGFVAVAAIAYAIFFWPDLAFRYREYLEQKNASSSKNKGIT